jgi:aspartate carbamoyltransferase
VLRHPAKGSAHRASYVSNIPIINGGDGNGEHPTQSLLDIFTIYTELRQKGIDLDTPGREDITITFVGDLKNSRTVHSLIRLLLHFPKLRFVYVSPGKLEMPEEIVRMVHHEQNKSRSLNDVIKKTDILYMTRIQKERFENAEEYDIIMENAWLFRLSRDTMNRAKENMIVMHPMPRLEEIPVEIDKDDRAAYFKQVENGLYMRMALLDSILGQFLREERT